MQFHGPERENRDFPGGFDEHGAVFARQSGDHMAADGDSGRVERPDGPFDRREIMAAPDQFEGCVVGGLNAELYPDLIPFRQFGQQPDRLRRQGIGTRADDDDREGGGFQHFAVESPQLLRRCMGRGERLKISDIRCFRPVALRRVGDAGGDLPLQIEFAGEMAGAVAVLRTEDAAGSEPVDPVRTPQRKVDSDPVKPLAVLPGNIIAEKMKLIHLTCVPIPVI